MRVRTRRNYSSGIFSSRPRRNPRLDLNLVLVVGAAAWLFLTQSGQKTLSQVTTGPGLLPPSPTGGGTTTQRRSQYTDLGKECSHDQDCQSGDCWFSGGGKCSPGRGEALADWINAGTPANW